MCIGAYWGYSANSILCIVSFKKGVFVTNDYLSAIRSISVVMK